MLTLVVDNPLVVHKFSEFPGPGSLRGLGGAQTTVYVKLKSSNYCGTGL